VRNLTILRYRIWGENMKSIVFTAGSSYARFRCPHTTTSALTFMTIHPVAVKGLIGAVMGIDYGDLYNFTKDIRIGIQVLNPVYKDMQSFNLVAMVKNNGAANFQSRVQFLRDVKYRLFVAGMGEKLQEFENVLKTKQYIFTPYLGCSEHIAKLNFEGVYDIIPTDEQDSDTIVPKEFAVLDDENDIQVLVDRIPVKNSEEREYIEYCKVAFTPGRKIKISGCNIVRVGEYNVFFF